ncbi:hypothetical protein TNCV_2760631 [Trichonephila clavipes]|nr:hypothetical protein TNCV_2760631 [Trichonephila clavipes]
MIISSPFGDDPFAASSSAIGYEAPYPISYFYDLVGIMESANKLHSVKPVIGVWPVMATRSADEKKAGELISALYSIVTGILYMKYSLNIIYILRLGGILLGSIIDLYANSEPLRVRIIRLIFRHDTHGARTVEHRIHKCSLARHVIMRVPLDVLDQSTPGMVRDAHQLDPTAALLRQAW